MKKQASSHLNRRKFLKLTGAGLAGGIFAHCANSFYQDNSVAKRPNILLIMADDMGYSDVGCYGGEINTPNLNSLAANGIRFTHFYNNARCCPTRASLLTGLYPHQTGVGLMMQDRGFDGYRGDLNENCVTIAEVLKQVGYKTYMSGKWHLTKQVDIWRDEKKYTSKHNWPCQRGFDRFYGTIHGAGSYYNPATLTRDNTPITPEKDDFYYTDAITDNAIAYLTDHVNAGADDPFFCYVSYTAPHWPLHALQEDINKYKGVYDIGWDKLRQNRLKRMIDLEIVQPEWKLSERDSRVPGWEGAENKDWEIRRMQVYAAQIDRMDQGIGRIVNTLEKTGQLENTLIIFLADNGGCAEELSSKWPVSLHFPDKQRDGSSLPHNGNDPAIMPGNENTYQSYGIPWANVSNTPFRLYKHYIHEGGIATPLIVHWPAGCKTKNEVRHQIGHINDIMATCIDVARTAYPAEYNGNEIKPLEGFSLAPAFQNKNTGRNLICWEHHGNRGIRKGKWKLVAEHKGRWELYDLEADRTETKNMAAEFPEKVEELKNEYQQWAKRCGVKKWPLPKISE